MTTAPGTKPLCGARTVFWPDQEACEAECALAAAHGGTIHWDEVLNEWGEDELLTTFPGG
ncbi:hypothetical protein ACFWCA_19675 [Streptomyces phaeochromogenes]|uniref:hypothetical protein n=1 Tax=Streptomyces phaeochromogenes TaxID=1923 RepID=UPI00368AC724